MMTGATFEPVGDRSAALLEHASHALVALSPFNNYYTQEIVSLHLRAAVNHFREIDVIIPGQNMSIILEVCGFSPAQAERKIAKNIRSLRNKILAGFDALNIPRLQAQKRIHSIDDLVGNVHYEAIFESIQLAYESRDPVFHAACVQAMQGVLLRLTQGNGIPTPDKQRTAAAFQLPEAVFMTDSPKIFGQSSSVLLYHRVIEFADVLFKNELTWSPVRNQGYAVIKPK